METQFTTKDFETLVNDSSTKERVERRKVVWNAVSEVDNIEELEGLKSLIQSTIDSIRRAN